MPLQVAVTVPDCADGVSRSELPGRTTTLVPGAIFVIFVSALRPSSGASG